MLKIHKNVLEIVSRDDDMGMRYLRDLIRGKKLHYSNITIGLQVHFESIARCLRYTLNRRENCLMRGGILTSGGGGCGGSKK